VSLSTVIAPPPPAGNEVADQILSSHGISDEVVPRVGTSPPVERGLEDEKR
jgi:hypothetical protein